MLGLVSGVVFRFTCGAEVVEARPSGALFAPASRTLVVADLHLGKSERTARRGGPMLPPYEVQETLARLREEIAAVDPATVVCLGDSFDDAASVEALDVAARSDLATMAAGRRWVWIAGNHDPRRPLGLAGEHQQVLAVGGLTFRHEPEPGAPPGEVNGHLHPKATLVLRGRRVSRRAFVEDGVRVLLPAFGAYTGGLSVADPAIRRLFGRDVRALLLGARATPVPLEALAG